MALFADEAMPDPDPQKESGWSQACALDELDERVVAQIEALAERRTPQWDAATGIDPGCIAPAGIGECRSPG